MGAWGAIGGAGLGLVQNKKKEDEVRRQNAQIEAQNRANPYFAFQTGQSINPGQRIEAPSKFDAALQGAIIGASAGQSFKGMGSGGGQDKPAVADASQGGSANMYDVNPNTGQTAQTSSQENPEILASRRNLFSSYKGKP